MFYKKKLDRAMEWLKEKNKSQDNESGIDGLEEDNNLEFEKKDILAIIISALLVFGPLFLVGIGIIYLMFR